MDSSSNKKPRLLLDKNESGSTTTTNSNEVVEVHQQEEKEQPNSRIQIQNHRLKTIRQWIAQPIEQLRDTTTGIFQDPYPASIQIQMENNNKEHEQADDDTDTERLQVHDLLHDTGVLIGNKHHAGDVPHLLKLGVTAVLNCASGGIANLPMDELKENGIVYGYTNCRQDDLHYPILHDYITLDEEETEETTTATTTSNDNNTNELQLKASHHLKVAKAMYLEEVVKKKGKLLFFCVAGQNRSAALAFAVLLLRGESSGYGGGKFKYTLDALCQSCSFRVVRPFILENQGFQTQLVQLEHYLATNKKGMTLKRYANGEEKKKKRDANNDGKTTMYAHGDYDTEEDTHNTNNNSIIMASTSYDTCDNDSVAASSTIQSRSRSRSRSQSVASFTTTTDSIVVTDTRERVEIELLIPGLCTMEVYIPSPSSIQEVKALLINHTNQYLLSNENENCDEPGTPKKSVAKAWVVLAMFGKDDMDDLPLEEEAIEYAIQLERIETVFKLQTTNAPPTTVAAVDDTNNNNSNSNGNSITTTNNRIVYWTSKCRFGLVIFSVYNGKNHDDDGNEEDDTNKEQYQEPWTFRHEERIGAPATLLENILMSTRLRGWDFVDGQAFASKEPIVFSFSPQGSLDKRQFMSISTCAQTAQQFHAPGEGGILGMGANAIVHRVELQSTSSPLRSSSSSTTTTNDNDNNNNNEENPQQESSCAWDAAVKRPFTLSKMIASLDKNSEAGLAKRLRQLESQNSSLLNSDGRLLYFYGLGVALSSNAYTPTEYKFEAVILARYEEEFSTYTMKRFMIDYTAVERVDVDTDEVDEVDASSSSGCWRNDFSLTHVKVLLVSLLNAFRDLTLMGVQAFDFNHLGNVLVSRDHQSVKLLDIDGDSKGSIQLNQYQNNNESTDYSSPSAMATTTTTTTTIANIPTKITRRRSRRSSIVLHKPSLDIDLNAVLPTVVQQLLLGKGRGTSFVVNTKSRIWKLPVPEAKQLIEQTIQENFGPLSESHMAKVVEWLYAMLKKQPPWGNWTHDIYDAMRCIDHLPIR